MPSLRRPEVYTARKLRREMSLPEVLLWQRLKNAQTGRKFRKQHPIGPYVLDFYCPAAKLDIEVDGDAHDMGSNPARDARRDAWLRERGLQVLRIPAAHLYGDIEPAVMLILSRCRR